MKGCPRFRLRTLLSAVTGAAVLFALVAREIHLARREAQAVAALRNARGRVYCRDLVLISWLGHLVGEDDVGPVTVVSLRARKIGPAELRYVAQLEKLEWLDLIDTPVTDDDLKWLFGLKRLKRVFLIGTAVTDEGERRLRSKLPQLKYVYRPADAQKRAQ